MMRILKEEFLQLIRQKQIKQWQNLAFKQVTFIEIRTLLSDSIICLFQVCVWISILGFSLKNFGNYWDTEKICENGQDGGILADKG